MYRKFWCKYVWDPFIKTECFVILWAVEIEHHISYTILYTFNSLTYLSVLKSVYKPAIHSLNLVNIPGFPYNCQIVLRFTVAYLVFEMKCVVFKFLLQAHLKLFICVTMREEKWRIIMMFYYFKQIEIDTYYGEKLTGSLL